MAATPDAAGARRRDAYLVGLTLLARRELSESQVRARLRRREFDDGEIDDALQRLREEKAVDDARVARAYARTEANIRQRGRDRILRVLHTMGIAPSTARTAVDEVFAEVDEGALLEQALQRRVRHGADVTNRQTLARLHRYLVGQGFEPGQVMELLRRRAKGIDEHA